MRFQKERGMEVTNVVKERDVRGRLSRQGYLESWSACGHFCALDFVLTYKERRSAASGYCDIPGKEPQGNWNQLISISNSGNGPDLAPPISYIRAICTIKSGRPCVFDSPQEPEGPVG